MSVLSKIKSAAKKVLSVVLNVPSKVTKSQGSNALDYSNSAATTAAYKASPTGKAETAATAAKKSDQQITTKVGGTTYYGSAGAKEAARVSSILNSSSGTFPSGTNLLSAPVAKQVAKGGFKSASNSLPKATAPTSADAINSGVGTINLSSGTSGAASYGSVAGAGTMGGAGIANAMGANEGLGVATDASIKSKEQIAVEEAKLADDQRKADDQNWVKNMLGQKKEIANDLEDKRADLEEENQIQAKRAEINSLAQTLGKMETEVANQIAATNDVLGTNNFINNQTKQIERNAAPELNRLRSDINFKTGILTQNEALIEKAMEQATAIAKQDWEDLLWFRKENKDIEDSISPEYKKALDNLELEKERTYKEDVAEKEWKRDVIMEYGLQGLTLNDSVDVILKSAARKQASNIASKNSVDTSNPISLLQNAINTRKDDGSYMTAEEAALDVAGYYESVGVQVDNKMINQWTTEARKLKPIQAETPAETSSTPFTAKGVGRSFQVPFETVAGITSPTNWYKGTKNIATTAGSFFSGLFGE